MNVTLQCNNLSGTIKAPPSKSYAHRYLIASMLAETPCTISNVNLSEDILATINALKELGSKVEIIDNKVIVSKILNFKNDNPIIDCKESGSTLRFIIPIALVLYNKIIIKGSSRLLERGINSYLDIFSNNNIDVINHNDFIEIKGKFTQKEYNISGSESSQYITGLLFALPLLPFDSVINIIPPITSKSYINITFDVLDKFHIQYEKKENSIFVKGNQKYVAYNSYIEGDYSNSAFLEAFNYLNNHIKVLNLKDDSVQGDKKYREYFKNLFVENCRIDLENNIDLGPILFVFASLFHGGTFINTKRLTIKESNRVIAMQNELAKLNICMEVNDNDVVIYSNIIKQPSEPLKTYNDHRIAMALSLFSSLFEIKLLNAECVKKSYPNYFKDLESVGAKIIYE